MDVASLALSLFVVFSNAHRWVQERLFLGGGDVFLKFLVTLFKERVLKKDSTHPGWLCLPLRPAAPSPSALKAVLPRRGEKKTLGGREAGGSVGLLAGNLCANATTVCIHARETFGRLRLCRCPRGGTKRPVSAGSAAGSSC